MTCAKKIVTATLAFPDGRAYVGTNACLSPQAECPRLPGEGYNKCISICRQPAHAEMVAMQQVNDTTDGHMMISGIGHVCDACQRAMAEAGVTWDLV